ncbi:MAG: YitT family protein [Flavipsychrobacter sp.]|jgi:uncharacterized membrane-anchored protein YitT (DUF2179 family)|nr:YitT family protein [Flavipsychrobacter sp.]
MVSALKHLPETVQDIVYSIIGTLITGFALKGFLVPNGALDGGVTGISLLLHELYHWNIAWVIVLINIPFIIAGAFHVNYKFALKTFSCVVALGLCLTFIDYPVITHDKILVSLFGGFFLGIGIGLAMRAGCSLDGIEVLALYTLKRSSFTISEIIMGLNAIIFLIAALMLGLETSLYSMLTYYVATKTIDYVIEGLEEYTGVTIISGKSEAIKEKLVLKMGKGITVYKGERGFLKDNFSHHAPCDIVFTIITRLEVRRLKNLVHSIDPNAFVFTNTIKEVAGAGGVVKHRKGH